MKRTHKVAAVGAALALAALAYWIFRSPWPEHEGELRQSAQLEVSGLSRGREGTVTLAVRAHYVQGQDLDSVGVDDLEPKKLTLIDAAGKPQALSPKWKKRRWAQSARLTLPDVPDGDYTLHAEYETDLGKGEVNLPLPLYAPARVHVLTDRPLYEPGHQVKFRAVVVRAADLTPLDGRPGRWLVIDPEGETVLEELAPAGAFGVVAGSFPLDRTATPGTWKVKWRSGAAEAETEIAVRPFTLPRLRVEATAELPFYSPNDPATLAKGRPRLRGAVTYASGAPVAGASVAVSWRVNGDWPPSREWLAALPERARAGVDGRFELELPPLPSDLQGAVTVVANLRATDEAGDTAAGSAQVLLSEHALAISAVTELGGGLAHGFNNRVYLRATTPDGRILQGAKLKVRRAWQASDPGVEAVVDEDGVAALQLDPGPPVNVIIPARPWRPATPPPPVQMAGARDLVRRAEASLEDQLAFERWLPAVAPCAKWVALERRLPLGLHVARDGAVVVAAEPGELARCVATAAKALRLPASGERLVALELVFHDPELPKLNVELEHLPAGDHDEVLEPLRLALADRAAAARDCLPMGQEGLLPRALTWRAIAGQRQLAIDGWVEVPEGGQALVSAMACVTSRFAATKVLLDEPATADALGLARLTLQMPDTLRQSRPRPTTMLGYELAISAELPGAPSTLLRLPPGEIPQVRLRLSPVLAKPGETVTAEILRGPGYQGKLPEKLSLRCNRKPLLAKLVERKAAFSLPAETSGFCQVEFRGARAMAYVKPAAELALSVSPSAATLAPGARVELTLRTTSGGNGVPAAVGLFGVDQSLADLAPLPGTEELERLLPTIVTPEPAFGALDGQALAMGRVLGANAAAAVVLQVGEVPATEQLDAVVHASTSESFDPSVELTDRFYVVLAELYVQARQWETQAPADEKLQPATLVKLWQRALEACGKRGEKIEDAFGRRLRLRVLPPELLALTDPTVVVSGTRLPEDIESWADYVARRRP